MINRTYKNHVIARVADGGRYAYEVYREGDAPYRVIGGLFLSEDEAREYIDEITQPTPFE
jgi:hypothetical protein